MEKKFVIKVKKKVATAVIIQVTSCCCSQNWLDCQIQCRIKKSKPFCDLLIVSRFKKSKYFSKLFADDLLFENLSDFNQYDIFVYTHIETPY